MKHMKRLMVLFLVVFLFVTIIPAEAFAVNRQYTVRISAGNKGTFDTGDPKEYIMKTTYDVYSYAYPGVTPETGYYVKGIKESGKEAILTSYNFSEDRDYVVAYGIKGNEVPYTVHYMLYGTSTELAPAATFYADVGDSPVSSYIYIEGYQPYRRSTKVLTGNAASDVLYVYYTRVTTTTGTTGTTTTVATGGGVVGGNANANANANANTATANANANNILPQPGYQVTEDIIDLDVPLAEFEGPEASQAPVLVPFVDASGETAQRKLPSGLMIALVAVLAGLIAALYWYLLFYRKKKKYANEVDYDFSFLDEQDDHNDFR